jgi:endonuclease/exonuclease/phosphatase family metal-dependent hydrolase
MTFASLLLAMTGSASAGCDGEGALNLSVVTLNAWGLPEPIARDRAGRMPKIARWLDEQGFDLAGLQEVWRGARGLLPLRLSIPDAREDSGLALQTPHAVDHLDLHAFQAERGLDALKSKGVLVADVTKGGDTFTVAVTHLQAGGGERNAGVRSAQVDEILGVLERSEHPVVLLGDFNLYADEAVDGRTRDRLDAEGFVDAAEAVGATGGTYPGLKDRFDRVFVRGGCVEPRSAEVLDRLALSDHHPVRVEMVVRR